MESPLRPAVRFSEPPLATPGETSGSDWDAALTGWEAPVAPQAKWTRAGRECSGTLESLERSQELPPEARALLKALADLARTHGVALEARSPAGWTLAVNQ